ncbi:MAG: DNA primase [Chloroflexi bacterium]|nr:DNA primase [Chloroflexota bacterium]
MPGPIEDIKSRVDIVELIAESVQLRKHRNYYSGLCPFHAHVNNTPSFAVWPDAQIWKCFGQCNTGGDVFTFVMKKEGVDFSEALRILAQRAGVELRQRSPEEAAKEEEHAHLRELLGDAATYFHNLLLHSPQAEHARQHILQRGLSVLTVEKFQLGYSLKSWDVLFNHLAGKGVTARDMIEAGLIIERDDGSGSYDRFRDRLMIPIYDANGKISGFGARALNPDDAPKFLNSPQTALFDKGRTLYGLSFARKAVRETGTAVIVEGYMDVMAAHQAGFANVVSPMGVALTEDHVRLLSRYAKRIVLALDADEAGRLAARRGGEIGATTEATVPIFERYENIKKAVSRKSIRLDTRVMLLPEGKDPDEVVLSDPGAWAELVASAVPILEFIIRTTTAGRDLDDPGVKADVAGELLPVIDQIADSVERDAYRQKLARILRVSESALLQKRAGAKEKSRTSAPVEARTEAQLSNGPISKLESYCIGALVRRPELLYKADRRLQEMGLEQLSEEDFTHAGHRAIFRALKAALAQDAADPADHLRDSLDESLFSALDALSAEAAQINPDEPSAVDDVLNAITRLRRRSVDSTLTQLRFLVEDAQGQGDSTPETFVQTIAKLAGARQKLDRALAGLR